MALRIDIGDQHPVAAAAKLGRQIDRHRRLTGAAFLVGDGQDFCVHPSSPVGLSEVSGSRTGHSQD